jgi:hypothetical protein
MAISQLLQKSEELTDWLRSTLNNSEIEFQHRTFMAYACLDITCEHREAIIMLVTNRLYGSAFALIRSVFESYIRGVWLYRCASDTEIEAFKTDKLKKNFEELVQDIENLKEYGEGVLLRLKQQGWRLMNSYTHTGVQQVLRRIKTDTLEPNYHDDEIEELLNCTNALGLMAALQIAIVSKNKELPMTILEKGTEFMGS